MCAFIDICDGALKQLLVGPKQEPSVNCCESQHLLLPAAISFHRLTVIRSAIWWLFLFELIFTLEELSQRNLLLANGSDKEQVKLSDVIDGNCRSAVRRRTNGGEVQRKPNGIIELFPA